MGGGVIFMNRPKFLTGWLIFMIIGNVFSLYSYTLGSANIAKTLPNMPSWAITVFAVGAVVNLFAVVMLWMWKKMGFYILIALAIIVASLNGMLLGIAGVFASLFSLIGVGILYLAMKPVWQNFK